MTNKLIIIFLAISLHKCVSAQSLESDKTLSFQNVSSIEFRPLEIDEVSFGYITRPNTLYRKKLIQGDTSSIADSNSLFSGYVQHWLDCNSEYWFSIISTNKRKRRFDVKHL